MFEGYPPAIVAECVNPRTGLARTREFAPTVASVVDWCDKRLQYHRNWASYRPAQLTIEKPDPPAKHPKILGWLKELAAKLKRPSSRKAEFDPKSKIVSDADIMRIYARSSDSISHETAQAE